MINQDEIERIVEIARQYYEQNLTQDEIAKNFGLSRPTISRLLKQAVTEKIVLINVINPFITSPRLSDKLKQTLHLDHCIVISGQVRETEIVRRNIALTAAKYLHDVVKPGEVIGIGWGRTLYQIANCIEPLTTRNLLFVPLLGGIGQIKPSLQVHSIIQKISDAFDGKWVQFHAPGILENKILLNQLLEINDVKEIMQYWKKAEKALVGIGENPSSSDVIFIDTVQNSERDWLIKNNAVGDICMRFFNKDGHPVRYKAQEILSIELDDLRNIPEVIAVASGDQKVDAIIGASNAGYINTLITDKLTALIILEKTEKL